MAPSVGRLRRLAEELTEAGLEVDGPVGDVLVEEVDHALRPPVHERRVSSSGTILHPTTDPATWEAGTALAFARSPTGDQPLDAARRFADGLSSWLVRFSGGSTEWLVFNRTAGSERDLGVIARVMGATIVQRHPAGLVRIVGAVGVLRWDGYRWHHEPPLERWIDVVRADGAPHAADVLRPLLEFAVHDLGANGIGALLIYRGDGSPAPDFEQRLPLPPQLRIDRPAHLAPLRHALAQLDGAAVFDARGVLRQLGVRLVPSGGAEESVDGYKGTRHTSGLRYSFDDPLSLVIAVSEDGPVSVFRNGAILGRSAPDPTS
ncbi:MAG: diadenylate cyclase [Actinomycetota bacterium]|nr:diadenylate cyclase [Actinomycetota bacterium]